ncbi:MAG: tyrosine-type recombinase/integrase [Azoarcus sp.]|jgi:integrase|nr:tyrosine-type recombinase/integrase [Azoarcus sp.]
MSRRKDKTLEPRVYLKHGAFYYVHRDRRWERLGTDIEQANARARLYNDTSSRHGTMSYWLDMFIIECENRVTAGELSARTLADYRKNIIPLKIFFADPMAPADIQPRHVQDYLAIGVQAGRPVRANREKSCLSSCISWLLRTGQAAGVTQNPCLRSSGIKRNRERKRDRYVTDDEYRDVYAVAPPQVQALMELCYRTLQRPDSDILSWTVANIISRQGLRVLRVQQNKTKKTLDIGMTPELDALLRRLVGDVPAIGRRLICTRQGKPYTYSGLTSMLTYAIGKANKARAREGRERIASFGFRDLKGKGATDMWLSGEPIERIQHLCGHESAQTTEIYVKQRWRESVQPNQIKIGENPVSS